ncbi:hypothetical protein BDN67DRAFT_1050639 [Paxillus ammoniavirescens]|nr:hypothetical protein BDN67DRAFT_1050639 [Paxillus ammoniavirescens]
MALTTFANELLCPVRLAVGSRIAHSLEQWKVLEVASKGEGPIRWLRVPVRTRVMGRGTKKWGIAIGVAARCLVTSPYYEASHQLIVRFGYQTMYVTTYERKIFAKFNTVQTICISNVIHDNPNDKYTEATEPRAQPVMHDTRPIRHSSQDNSDVKYTNTTQHSITEVKAQIMASKAALKDASQ